MTFLIVTVQSLSNKISLFNFQYPRPHSSEPKFKVIVTILRSDLPLASTLAVLSSLKKIQPSCGVRLGVGLGICFS